MSGTVQLREIDRGVKGKLTATLERASKAFVLFSHLNADGSPGGRLVVLVDEIPTMLDVLRSASQIANAKHRTVSAVDVAAQLAEDKRLF